MATYQLELPTITTHRIMDQHDLEDLILIHRRDPHRILGEGWETHPATLIDWQGAAAIMTSQNEHTGQLGGLYLAGLGWWRIESSNGHVVVIPPSDEPLAANQLPPEMLLPVFMFGPIPLDGNEYQPRQELIALPPAVVTDEEYVYVQVENTNEDYT